MLNVTFFVRGGNKNARQDAELTIYCQLAMESEGRDTPFSTRITVPAQYWWTQYEPITNTNRTDKWIHESYYLAENVNHKLREIARKIQGIYDALDVFYEGEKVTFSHIRRHYDPNSNKIIRDKQSKAAVTLGQTYDEFLKAKKTENAIRQGTLKTYTSRIQNIYQWCGESLRIDKIRHRHIEELHEWLVECKNEDGTQKFCRNYRNKHLTLFRDIVGYAVKKEYIESMPIVSLNLKYDDDKPPQYLLPAQRNALLEISTPSLEKQRDIAQFLMYTGFSYIDFLELRDEHLLHGKCWKKQRHKSSIFSLPILLPKAKEIIDKYGSVNKIPRMDNSDFNKDLKHMSHIAGIANDLLHPLRASDFRETFASMLENEFMFEGRVVMVMMGHTNQRQLNSYSRLMPERIMYELDIWKKRVGFDEEKMSV